MIKTSLGYPDADGTRELIDRRADRDRPDPTVEPVVGREDVRELQTVPESVTVEGQIRDYLGELCRATREDGRVDVGVSRGCPAAVRGESRTCRPRRPGVRRPRRRQTLRSRRSPTDSC